MKKSYDIAVAEALLEFAFPEWDFPPYVILTDGVYMSDEHRKASPPEQAFDWSPAYDMDGLNAPNPMTAPILPIPFGAPELAAFMLDGAGSMIPEALESRIGCNDPDLDRFSHPRNRMLREALHDAWALLNLAVQHVGPPNDEQMADAQNLMQQCDKENNLANEREGVFAPGISDDEYRARRARALASVADLKARAEQAQATATQNWKTWRKAMVKALLGTNEAEADSSTREDVAEKAEDRGQSGALENIVLNHERHWVKKAMVAELIGIWPTIRADLSEASRLKSGLKEANVKRCYWDVEMCIRWAVSQGKIKRDQATKNYVVENEGSNFSAILKASFPNLV